METFDKIYLDLSKSSGRCRFADSGIGWKPSEGQTWTLDRDQIDHAQWSRATKGYELRIYTTNHVVHQLDGFQSENVEQVSKIFKNWYSKPFDSKEHSLRGWNWGKSDFSKDELTFNVQSRPAFEIPYSEIANTNLAGKNEVVVEFSLPSGGPENGTNGANGTSKKVRGKKAASSLDQLVEMRFYIPGTAKREGDEESGEENEKPEAEEEQNAAQLFYDRIIDKAQIGEGSGDQIATFLEVLHLTPRGRFDIQLYESFVRLVGKTYDQKISHDRIKKFFLLPKPDDVHQLITIGLDPPLTQGQTKYPFLVMQFKLDEETILDLNLTDEQIAGQYDGKLQQHYEAPMSTVVAQVFRGLYGKKIITPSRDFASVHGQSGLKCSIKANEGLLYCLSQAFLFVPKPASYISFEKISVVTLSRVGGALAASRTFDVTLTLKSGEEHQFSNINKEEQTTLIEFLRLKGLKVKNEMAEELKALKDVSDISDDEAVAVDRGSADEDEESADEDFKGDSDSDVAEEFDSQHESSGEDSGEDELNDDAEDDMDVDDEEEEEVEEKPPKKKTKTARK